jgi:hypothetical protein
VTKATEDTKAEITGRLWEQQWQSTQKRDAYVRLVDALERLEIKRGLLKRSSDASEKADARRTGLEARLRNSSWPFPLRMSQFPRLPEKIVANWVP